MKVVSRIRARKAVLPKNIIISLATSDETSSVVKENETGVCKHG